MLIDSRELANGAALQCDLCIVGGGAAGITMARALADTALDVIVIESGGVNPDAATQALYEGENVGAPLVRNLLPTSITATRLRYLGGSTNHWAGWCRPLSPVDFEARSHLALSGWPLSYDDLDPWYRQAQDVCLLGPYRYEAEDWESAGLPVIDNDRVATTIIQINLAARFGHAYLDELRSAQNVRVCLWGNVTELTTDEDASRVEEVQVATLDGGRYRVRARSFVLATGGLEVPRLLLATNAVRPSGLGNEHDLVGRHFTEHLQVPIAISVFNRPRDGLRLYDQTTLPNTEQPGRDMAIKGVLTLTPDVIRERELLGLDAQLVFGDLATTAPGQEDGADAKAVASLLEAAERQPVPTVAVLAAVGEQAVNPESRVTLSPRRRDALGMPEIVLDWRYGEQDRASMLEGLVIMATELATAGVGRLQVLPGGLQPNLEGDITGDVTALVTVDPAAIDPDGFEFGIGNHHMGTTRMDPDPRRGVVDEDGKVHSVDNLYIAGSAVFPTGGVVPPTLTLVALALRLADHLKRALA